MPIAHKAARRPVVIITDPTDYGDDNVAILMLLRSQQVDIRGIITTGGNVCAQRGAVEASGLLRAAGTSIPVVEGFPLAWHQERRAYFENTERPSWQRRAYVGAFAEERSCDAAGEASAASEPASKTEAADFLIAQARASKGRLTIILIGPATVLAEAMRREPALAGLIHRVNAMGGAMRVAGNVTAHAEFNVWFDPEAMQAVLASRVPMTLVPLDATAGMTYDRLTRPAEQASGFAATHLATYLERKGAKGNPVGMWDEVLAAIVIDPTLVETTEELYLSVSTAKDDRYGKIVSSSVAEGGALRTVEVVTKVRTDGVRQLLARLLLAGG
jgi:inosine-uridine nucleoside N-ribohydrolase